MFYASKTGAMVYSTQLEGRSCGPEVPARTAFEFWSFLASKDESFYFTEIDKLELASLGLEVIAAIQL